MKDDMLKKIEDLYDLDKHQEIIDMIEALPAEQLNNELIGQLGRAYNNIQNYEKAIEQVGMLEFKDRQISELSGGQQQRAFIARALVQEADIYLMDEPFQGVDSTTEKSIVDILKKIKSDGKTLLVVHHDLQTVPTYFESVTFINKTVIASGKVKEAFTQENIEMTYRK